MFYREMINAVLQVGNASCSTGRQFCSTGRQFCLTMALSFARLLDIPFLV